MHNDNTNPPNLINGSWIQTIAYLLHDLQCNTGTTVGSSASTICEDVQTTIVVEEFVDGRPRTIVTTITRPQPANEPPIIFSRIRTVLTGTNYITKIINGIDVFRMKLKLCGGHYMRSNVLDCWNCVQAYFDANPDALVRDYSRSNTGCSNCGITVIEEENREMILNPPRIISTPANNNNFIIRTR
jgi:hypothetical protein